MDNNVPNNDFNQNNYGQNGYSQPSYNQTPNVQVENNNVNYAGKYKLTLSRPKSYVASLMKFKIYIDGDLVGKLKNGQTMIVELTPGEHDIAVEKNAPITLNLMGDTSADVIFVGTNCYKICNIKGPGINYVDDTSSVVAKNTKSQTNSVLYVTLGFIIFSVIFAFLAHRVIAAWSYGLLIGYCIININSLKNIKETDNAQYKSLMTKNIIALVLDIIAIVITIMITV